MGRKKLVRKAEPPAKRGIRWPRWTGFRGMTVRDWLELLIVPLSLVVLSLMFTAQQNQSQQRIETHRAEVERGLAEQRAQDETLQAYLDQMSTLLLEKDLRNSETDSEVQTLAQARTLSALGRVDTSHKEAIVRFLMDADLVYQKRYYRREGPPVIRGPIILLTQTNLAETDLRFAMLYNAELAEANLSGANLRRANLSGANLSKADLSGANLSGAELIGTNLAGTDLRRADLSGAKLGDANKELLTQHHSSSLEGATMPNDQKYEDWFKDKGGRK